MADEIPEEYRGDNYVSIFWHPTGYVVVLRNKLEDSLADMAEREAVQYKHITPIFQNVNLPFFKKADKYTKSLPVDVKLDKIELSDILEE